MNNTPENPPAPPPGYDPLPGYELAGQAKDYPKGTKFYGLVFNIDGKWCGEDSLETPWLLDDCFEDDWLAARIGETRNLRIAGEPEPATATLRDQFAMAALPSVIGKHIAVAQAGWQVDAAWLAYSMADAMLGERSKP